MYRHLYLLMEIADREFESKLLLAFHAVQQGWKVIICPRLYFLDNIKRFPQGVVVYKSITPSDMVIIKQVKDYGHMFLCIDEEGINQRDEEYSLHIRYGEKSLEMTDKLFLLNKRQESLLNENYNVGQGKLSVTGYPRIEFIRLLKESNKHEISNKLLSQYGKYIFVATSFANSNHIQGHFGLKYNFSSSVENLSGQQERLFHGKVKLSEYVQKKYERLIETVAKRFPDTNIVLRPHPSESSIYYKRRYKDHPNIIVEYKYPALYYIKACELVVQYGSTIAIESSILGKPCLQFEPELPTDLEKYVIAENRSYAITLPTIEKTVSKIEEVINRVENETVENLYPVDADASKNIVSFLSQIVVDNRKKKLFVPRVSFEQSKRFIRYAMFWFIAKTSIINLLPQRLLKGKYAILKKDSKSMHLGVFQYLERKNGKISKDRIRDSINMFKEKWPSLNGSVVVDKKAFNAYEIEIQQ